MSHGELETARSALPPGSKQPLIGRWVICSGTGNLPENPVLLGGTEEHTDPPPDQTVVFEGGGRNYK